MTALHFVLIFGATNLLAVYINFITMEKLSKLEKELSDIKLILGSKTLPS